MPKQNAHTTLRSGALMMAGPAEGRPVGQAAEELGVSV